MPRRGGPPDFKDQLGAIFRTTLAQLDSVRDAVVQRGKVGKIQLDLTMLRRRRKAALAELGEAVAKLAAAGRIDEEKYPELSRGLARLEEIDERIEEAEERAREVSAGFGGDRRRPGGFGGSGRSPTRPSPGADDYEPIPSSARPRPRPPSEEYEQGFDDEGLDEEEFEEYMRGAAEEDMEEDAEEDAVTNTAAGEQAEAIPSSSARSPRPRRG